MYSQKSDYPASAETVNINNKVILKFNLSTPEGKPSPISHFNLTIKSSEVLNADKSPAVVFQGELKLTEMDITKFMSKTSNPDAKLYIYRSFDRGGEFVPTTQYSVVPADKAMRNGTESENSALTKININGVIVSSLADATGQTATSIFVSEDSSSINFNIKGNGMGKNGEIFIDADNNPATGYVFYAGANAGAEYMIENGRLFLHSTNDNTWTWKDIGGVSMVASSTSFQASVEKTALKGLSTSIKVRFVDIDDNWKTVSTLPKSGALPEYKRK